MTIIRPKSSELISLTVASISYNKTPTPRDALTPQFQLRSRPPELFHKFCNDSISENVS